MPQDDLITRLRGQRGDILNFYADNAGLLRTLYKRHHADSETLFADYIYKIDKVITAFDEYKNGAPGCKKQLDDSIEAYKSAYAAIIGPAEEMQTTFRSNLESDLYNEDNVYKDMRLSTLAQDIINNSQPLTDSVEFCRSIFASGLYSAETHREYPLQTFFNEAALVLNGDDVFDPQEQQKLREIGDKNGTPIMVDKESLMFKDSTYNKGGYVPEHIRHLGNRPAN